METCVRRLSGRAVPFVASLALLSAGVPTVASAQAPEPGGAVPVRTFYLKNGSTQDDSDIMVALRNILDPRVKVYFVASQRAIVLEAPTEQITLAQQLIQDLDRPHKLYRLIFRFKESDGGTPMPVHEVRAMAVAGEKLTVKEGDKIPVETGEFNEGGAKSQTQFTYLDVGLNLDATVHDVGGALQLSAKVEQSSSANSQVGPQDPLVHQTVLVGTTNLVPGRAQVLGTMDVPNTNRHIEVEVMAEPVA